MKRRTIFQIFATLGLIGKASAHEIKSTVPPLRYVLQSSPLRGYPYRQSPALLEQLQVGTLLTLRAEPENPHDANAVMVFCQQHHLGYLPRENNTHASSLLRSGLALNARITSLNPDHSWSPIRMEVLVAQPLPPTPPAIRLGLLSRILQHRSLNR